MATVNEKMTAIADAIRDKTGETESLTLDDMATDIPKVYYKGFDWGYRAGHIDGYNEGEIDGIEAGKAAQYDEFWDNFQDYGKNTDYIRGFSSRGWNDGNFKPKYDIKPKGSFAQGFMYSYITDVAEALKNAGVIFDVTQATSFSEFVGYSRVSRLPEMITYGVTGFARAFASQNLVTIDKLVLKEDGSQTFSYTFDGSKKLTNITIEGKVGQNIDFSASPLLTYDSLMSIINALKDYSATTTTRTLALHADSKAKLSDSDIAIATQKGWTIA